MADEKLKQVLQDAYGRLPSPEPDPRQVTREVLREARRRARVRLGAGLAAAAAVAAAVGVFAWLGTSPKGPTPGPGVAKVSPAALPIQVRRPRPMLPEVPTLSLNILPLSAASCQVRMDTPSMSLPAGIVQSPPGRSSDLVGTCVAIAFPTLPR